MNIQLQRTDSTNAEFQALVKLLDAELKTVDGDLNSFYHQFNGIASLKEVVLLYVDGRAVACGAIKAFADDRAEIKRMYVKEAARGKGLAGMVLKELEEWAQELGFKALVLETGQGQKAAIALYKKHHYQRIPNFPPYDGVSNSYCYQKVL